jgi:hypothetical protein
VWGGCPAPQRRRNVRMRTCGARITCDGFVIVCHGSLPSSDGLLGQFLQLAREPIYCTGMLLAGPATVADTKAVPTPSSTVNGGGGGGRRVVD